MFHLQTKVKLKIMLIYDFCIPGLDMQRMFHWQSNKVLLEYIDNSFIHKQIMSKTLDLPEATSSSGPSFETRPTVSKPTTGTNE